MAVQELLFGGLAPRLDPTFPGVVRHDLGHGAWLDHHPTWIRGHDTLFDHLEAGTTWHREERPMYERMVAVPRLTAKLPADGPGHPSLLQASAALSERYRRPIPAINLALYRGGDDSVAFHSDRVGADRLDDSIVAIVSLRGPRRLRIRAKVGGFSQAFDLGFGDLLVMGGSVQRHFDHGVAKVAGAPARMSVMLREG
jgi:alkylated DNA repair dioxygenase AlkB